ncbi:MAG: Rossmann-like and DUF2520 domain-containing protein [Desulfobacteria bacterium]
MKRAIAIVGCGTIGTTLGRLFAEAGYPIAGVASHRIESARTAAEFIGTSNYSDNPAHITLDADIVFITTTDICIEPVCDEIAQNRAFKKGAFVFHCSGALPSGILRSARYCGAYTGSIHPLQSVASVKEALHTIAGCTCVFEGEPEVLLTARELVRGIGADFMQIGERDKPLYHAAAVVASNYLVTLVSVATELNEIIGISGRSSAKGLLCLIRGTLDNLEKLGISDALTGPIARGDIGTIASHIDAIKRRAPHLLSLYKALGEMTVSIAGTNGKLDTDTIESMQTLLAA